MKLSIFLGFALSNTILTIHPNTYRRSRIGARDFDGNLLGLNPFNLNRNGISIGFLPGLGEPISPITPKEINAKLSTPMSIMGDYINLEPGDPNLTLIDAHIGYITALEGNPVWQLALMPYEGLEGVTQEVANNIGRKMRWINEQGIIVWLRFAHEMNGDWYKWGLQPDLFVEKWKLVTEAVRSQTQNTYMLWAPNSEFGPLDGLLGGYNKYWPGAQYVDIIGLSFYHYGGHGRTNTLPGPDDALQKMKSFADVFSTPNNNLPFVLAETGASYTRSKETGVPALGGATEYDIKYAWLQQLLSKRISESIPSLRAISWFEVIKDENAAGNTPVKEEDFRLVTGQFDLSRDSMAFFTSVEL